MFHLKKITDKAKPHILFTISNLYDCRQGSLIVDYNLHPASDLSEYNISYAAGFIQHYLDDNNNTLKVGNVTTQVQEVNATIGDKEGK